MPSAFAGRVPLLGRRRPGQMFWLVTAMTLMLTAGCTGPPSPPPGSGTVRTTSATPATAPSTGPSGTQPSTIGGTATGTADSSTDTGGPGSTSTSNPVGDIGSDHFVPFRTTVPNSAQGKRFGLIGLDQTNPFSKLVSESIKQQAQIAGAELVYCDAENNAEVALRCARRLASQGVDAWVTFQPVQSAGQSICGAGPKDVPMISVDSTLGSCASTRVGTDDQWAGFSVGTAMGGFVRDRFDCHYDSVIYLVDPGRGFADHRRQTGAELGLTVTCPFSKDRPPSQQLAVSGQDGAFTAVGKTLTAIGKDKRVLIFGTNDGLTLGAVGAARAAGRLDNVYVAGIGADPRSYCEIATDPHWVGDAASFPERYGELVIPYLVDLIDGKPVPENLFVRNEFLDAATIAEHYDVSSCEQTP